MNGENTPTEQEQNGFGEATTEKHVRSAESIIASIVQTLPNKEIRSKERARVGQIYCTEYEKATGGNFARKESDIIKRSHGDAIEDPNKYNRRVIKYNAVENSGGTDEDFKSARDTGRTIGDGNRGIGRCTGVGAGTEGEDRRGARGIQDQDDYEIALDSATEILGGSGSPDNREMGEEINPSTPREQKGGRFNGDQQDYYNVEKRGDRFRAGNCEDNIEYDYEWRRNGGFHRNIGDYSGIDGDRRNNRCGSQCAECVEKEYYRREKEREREEEGRLEIERFVREREKSGNQVFNISDYQTPARGCGDTKDRFFNNRFLGVREKEISKIGRARRGFGEGCENELLSRRLSFTNVELDSGSNRFNGETEGGGIGEISPIHNGKHAECEQDIKRIRGNGRGRDIDSPGFDRVLDQCDGYLSRNGAGEEVSGSDRERFGETKARCTFGDREHKNSGAGMGGSNVFFSGEEGDRSFTRPEPNPSQCDEEIIDPITAFRHNREAANIGKDCIVWCPKKQIVLCVELMDLPVFKALSTLEYIELVKESTSRAGNGRYQWDDLVYLGFWKDIFGQIWNLMLYKNERYALLLKSNAKN